MTSNTISFYFPIYLIRRLDIYLERTKLELSRSALLKFCITFHPNLTVNQKKRAEDMNRLLIQRSRGRLYCTPLRCKHRLTPTINEAKHVCEVLVFLNIDKDILNLQYD